MPWDFDLRRVSRQSIIVVGDELRRTDPLGVSPFSPWTSWMPDAAYAFALPLWKASFLVCLEWSQRPSNRGYRSLLQSTASLRCSRNFRAADGKR